jgi:hypothetical protein
LQIVFLFDFILVCEIWVAERSVTAINCAFPYIDNITRTVGAVDDIVIVKHFKERADIGFRGETTADRNHGILDLSSLSNLN